MQRRTLLSDQLVTFSLSLSQNICKCCNSKLVWSRGECSRAGAAARFLGGSRVWNTARSDSGEQTAVSAGSGRS